MQGLWGSGGVGLRGSEVLGLWGSGALGYLIGQYVVLHMGFVRFICNYMYVYVFVQMSAGTWKDQRHSFSLDLELKEVVSHQGWVLGTELPCLISPELLRSLMVISQN